MAQGERIHLQGRRRRRLEFDPCVGKILWRRKGQPTPIFLPEKFHGQQSLMVYSPYRLKESDMTEATDHSTGRKKMRETMGCRCQLMLWWESF